MQSTMVSDNGSDSQKKRPNKFQLAYLNALTPTKTPSIMSTDYSEPECEIESSEEPCDVHSVQKLVQPTSVPANSLSPSREDGLFHEESNDIPTCEDHKSCTAPYDENQGRTTPEFKSDWSTDSMDELKPERPQDNSDPDHEDSYNPGELIKAPKDHRVTLLDDSASMQEFENAMFSMPLFDATAGIEDDLSFCFDLEGTESEIQVAVNEIRKEAEKIDTILVLDQFKTLQTDFDSVSKKCSLKTMENEDLKMQLDELENRVAHMELERDLHFADAAKLREDLNTVVSKMFDISMYESSDLDESIAAIKENIDSCQSDKRLALALRPNTTYPNKNHSLAIIAKNHGVRKDGTNKKTLKRENICILGIVDQPRHAIRRLPQLIDPGAARATSHHEWSRFSEADTTRLLPLPSGHQTLRDQNVFRKRDNNSGRRPQTEVIQARRQSMPRVPLYTAGKDSKRTVLQRDKTLSGVETHSTSLVTETCDEETETQKKRCKMLFRCRSKKRSYSKDDVSGLKQQINQLKETMRMSLAASEKLRKRFKASTQYYEGIICKLQKKVADVKREKSKAQDDLASAISQVDVERRLEKSKFEYGLRRKDEEIARLKAGIDQGEV